MSERALYERVETIHGYKYLRLKGGRLVTFWDMLTAAQRAQTDLSRAVSRALKLAGTDYDLERLEWFAEGMQEWTAHLLSEIEKRRGVKTQEERIALLRNMTTVNGCTEAEALTAAAMADKLERKIT